MTRKYTDTLKNDVLTYLPDNNEGLISPADIRLINTDTIDSLRPSFAYLYGAPLSIPMPLTTAWAPIVGIDNYPTKLESDNTEIYADQALGACVTKFALWTHRIVANIAFTAANGDLVQMAIGLNGVPVGVWMSMSGAGAGREVTTSVTTYNRSQNVDDKYQILLRSDASINTTIIANQLICELVSSRFP